MGSPRRACLSSCSTLLVSLLAIVLASCADKPAASAALPKVAGAWTLTEEKVLAADAYPQVLATLGVVDARTAVYAGPSPVTVRVFRMKSGTVAFEALQKWKPEKGVMHFYREAYFVLAETADMKFVDAFDKATAWGRPGA